MDSPPYAKKYGAYNKVEQFFYLGDGAWHRWHYNQRRCEVDNKCGRSPFVAITFFFFFFIACEASPKVSRGDRIAQ